MRVKGGIRDRMKRGDERGTRANLTFPGITVY